MYDIDKIAKERGGYGKLDPAAVRFLRQKNEETLKKEMEYKAGNRLVANQKIVELLSNIIGESPKIRFMDIFKPLGIEIEEESTDTLEKLENYYNNN